jgi:transposase
MFPGMETTTSLVPASDAATEPVLLKTDVLGRVKHTREQRERILEEFERSGLSGASYAALVGVKYQTFATWVQARKRGRPTSPKRKPRRQQTGQVKWLEAVVRQTTVPAGGTGLLLHLPGGVSAELTSDQHARLAAALVHALEKAC